MCVHPVESHTHMYTVANTPPHTDAHTYTYTVTCSHTHTCINTGDEFDGIIGKGKTQKGQINMQSRKRDRFSFFIFFKLLATPPATRYTGCCKLCPSDRWKKRPLHKLFLLAAELVLLGCSSGGCTLGASFSCAYLQVSIILWC